MEETQKIMKNADLENVTLRRKLISNLQTKLEKLEANPEYNNEKIINCSKKIGAGLFHLARDYGNREDYKDAGKYLLKAINLSVKKKSHTEKEQNEILNMTKAVVESFNQTGQKTKAKDASEMHKIISSRFNKENLK